MQSVSLKGNSIDDAAYLISRHQPLQSHIVQDKDTVNMPEYTMSSVSERVRSRTVENRVKVESAGLMR